MFLNTGAPVVEYRLWPIAKFPGNFWIVVSFVKLSPTKPNLLSEKKFLPLNNHTR